MGALLWAVGCMAAWAAASLPNSGAPQVALVRVPNRGLQPQAAMAADGTLRLVYFSGEPGHGDLYAVSSKDGGLSWTAPVRVNSESGSAIATGNIRGAHVALGRGDRMHVAWNGSQTATPRTGDGGAPMLYTRLNEAGTGFEAQRNLALHSRGVDGGGAIAATREGGVYAFWHAAPLGKDGEVARRVWIAESGDEGATFLPDRVAWDEPVGACGCCGLNAASDERGGLYVLFRSAREMVHRDMYLLRRPVGARDFSGRKVSEWEVGYCVMSTAAFGGGRGEMLGAWESAGQVYFERVDGEGGTAVAAPGQGGHRKYPSVAVNERGQVLLAWTEGMGWKKGGALAWQVFDEDGRPMGPTGHADGVPAWSLVAAIARPNGTFTLLY